MRHSVAIAGREVRSLFQSPVAYVVLALWSLLAGTFFLAGLLEFEGRLRQAQQFQAFDALRQINLNDDLIAPFLLSMWLLMLFLIPAVTMGLFASEKQNGTEELLMTSPLSIWEIVIGKFAAGAAFALLLTAIAAFYPALLFFYGDPELPKTAAGLLGLFLSSLCFLSVGAFASSLTRNQFIAFVVSLVLLLVLGMMLPAIVQIGLADDSLGQGSALVATMRWISTGEHFSNLIRGLVSSQDLVYFGVVTSVFLLFAKTAVESVRWR